MTASNQPGDVSTSARIKVIVVCNYHDLGIRFYYYTSEKHILKHDHTITAIFKINYHERITKI